MKTDRELLEAAAKAAGIVWTRYDEPVENHWRPWGLVIGSSDSLLGGLEVLYWNPITDDGDALRLAVGLGLDVCIDTPNANAPHTHVIGFLNNHTANTVDAMEMHGDPYAATRRAIVRAAAAIGDGKEGSK